MKHHQVAPDPGHFATAKATNLPISTKHSVEICGYLRYKNTAFAKQFLNEVAALRKAVPFRRFHKDTGHKPGMAAGRYPRKAAKEFLRLIKAVEANAQVKGLNTSRLKISKLLANKASIPLTGGRLGTRTRRTNLEIAVNEFGEKKKANDVKHESQTKNIKGLKNIAESKDNSAEPKIEAQKK